MACCSSIIAYSKPVDCENKKTLLFVPIVCFFHQTVTLLMICFFQMKSTDFLWVRCNNTPCQQHYQKKSKIFKQTKEEQTMPLKNITHDIETKSNLDADLYCMWLYHSSLPTETTCTCSHLEFITVISILPNRGWKSKLAWFPIAKRLCTCIVVIRYEEHDQDGGSFAFTASIVYEEQFC